MSKKTTPPAAKKPAPRRAARGKPKPDRHSQARALLLVTLDAVGCAFHAISRVPATRTARR